MAVRRAGADTTVWVEFDMGSLTLPVGLLTVGIEFWAVVVLDGYLDVKENWKDSHSTRTLLSSGLQEKSGWALDITRCSKKAESEVCLRISYSRRIACGPVWQHDEWRTIDYSWFEALDPDSYGLCQDKFTEGSLWCRNSRCTNFYRYLERPIVRKCCGSYVATFYGRHNDTVNRVTWGINGKRFHIHLPFRRYHFKET
ncbi:hypothetical protein B0T16DRAFT_459099 [Cercophora newfieldiana]|uniref:Uncharacterized protein n=1 Tax=Cercophora newfieldiana TaxID=92897 RepID=A0AA39XZC0_9PEZI|nr:hypothetical protein B0T16DRAFT_459099 [Cercophora newfieldiana]